MLIHTLQLINFKKYANLLIEDLPEKGVVKVGGKNESGKTSIGEAVCFALFGRTFLTDTKKVKHLIHWGETEMSVALTLVNDDDELFKITRTVNNDPLASIRVVRLSDHYTLTDSLQDSDKVISDLLGYNYDTFVDSFCMVQRELTAPEANSQSIKQMAGISDYGHISDELATEQEEEKILLNALKPHYNEINIELQAIGLDESWLPELVDANESLSVNKADKKRFISELTQINDSYPENSKQYRKVKRQHYIFEWFGAFLLPLIVVSWIVWGGFQFFPEMIKTWLPNGTSSYHGHAFIAWVQTWMFPFAMGCVLLYSISLFFKWLAESKIAVLKEKADICCLALKRGYHEVIRETKDIVPTRVAKQFISQLSPLNEAGTSLQLSSVEKFNHLPKLIESSLKYHATTAEVLTSVSDLQDVLHSQGGDVEQYLLALEQEMLVEKNRSDAAGLLRANLQKISQTMSKHRKTIRIHECSLQMMQRAAFDSIENFNQQTVKFAEKALPHFTANRYSQLKINADLSVEVFSDEKQSYMAYDEISSGTQRQIMLALRMGMSEQLAKNTGNKKQFIFLDEPFAFFDHQRSISTLAALPKVSKTISQVWVTSQEFPDELTLGVSKN